MLRLYWGASSASRLAMSSAFSSLSALLSCRACKGGAKWSICSGGVGMPLSHSCSRVTLVARSLVRVRLETGRQHQIRAHLAWLGCPVVGDPRYGTAGRRLGLHALRLMIVHPATGEPLTFEAPVPADFWALLPAPPARAGRP